jgi:protein TonB
MGLLLLLPLLKTVVPPSGRALATPVSWGAPPAAAPHVQHQRSTTIVQSNISDNELIAPREIPRQVAHIEEMAPPPQVSFNDLGVEGSTGTGSRSGIWGAIRDSIHAVAPPAPPAASTVRQFRTSRMLEGNLIRRVQPTYPPLARNARIQGKVVLTAIISKTGTIENLQLVSGHPMLVPAAIDAVSQWRYRPYILNGDPIEVETQITVNFTLSGN